MDLAEKRKQLEALRAARQAKQQVVEQYMSGRISNTDGSPTSSASLPSGPAGTASPPGTALVTGITPLTSPKSISALPTAPSPRTSGAAAAPATAGTTRRLSGSTTAKMASSPVAVASPTIPAPQRVRTGTPSGKHVDPSSFSSKAQASPRPTQTAAAPAASSSMPPAAASPQLIQVLHVRKDGVASPTAAAAAAGAAPAAPRATPRPPADAPMTPRPGTSPPATAAMTTSGGWGLLHHSARGVGGAGGAASATTQPACIFNPSVLLGDGGSGGSAEESRRRVVLDATACLVPYHGASAASQHPQGHREDAAAAESEGAPVWSVCVAAAYGSAGAGSGMAGSAAGGGGAAAGGVGGGGVGGLMGTGDAFGYDMRAGAAASTAGGDPLSAIGVTGSFAGQPQASPPRGPAAAASPGSAAAAAAAAGVRASMECGYPWGCASAAPAAAVPRSTMDAALRMAKSAPGLVLAWFVVPLPPNTVPRNEGPFAGAAAAAGDAGGGATAASPNAAGDRNSGRTASAAAAAAAAAAAVGGDGAADYVTVVLPLVCDSEVTTLLAHPFQPSTLLGGTRCGRIVQWSMGQAWSQVEPRRLSERALATTGTTTTLLLPPQRPAHSSFPSPQAHQAPILRMAIHGDASCHHLYSISQEGKVCTWPAWQPLHPTASCLSYLGIRPMGSIGVAAQFVERPGTDAMTKVFIGTTSGALLVGANRDAKSIELQYYGPPRALPTSSTVIKTLDVTATASPELPGGSEHGSLLHSSMSSLRRTAASSPPGASAAAAAAAAAPHPHRGRVVSMALQTSTHGLRGRDCVVSAATDGSCVAWFDRSVVPLEGFSSAVTSVCWSPTRPGILAAGDAIGLVTVWSVSVSIITPVATVSLRDAGRRARGNATSDGVLWVVPGSGDAGAGATAGAMGGGGGGAAAAFGLGGDEDEADLVDGEDAAAASLGQADVVGAAICAVFFSRDGQWLFASTGSGYVHTLRLSSALL